MGECNHAGQMIGISDGSSIYAWKCLNCGQQFPRNAFVRGKWRVDSANERLKGGDANADPTGSNPSTKSIPATSPGVTAGASEIEELCKRLEEAANSCDDERFNSFRRKFWITIADMFRNAAALIRRLVSERDDAHEEAYTTDNDGQSVTWHELYEAEHSIRQYNQRRATAAEAEVARLRAALKPFAKAASDYERQGEFFSNNIELVLRVSVFAAPEYHNSTAVQVGDLRRARTALEGKSDGK